MHKHRLLFAKTGRACYISHLDLMRTFPRAFLRAGIDVKQTEGFNQHSFVSIALPLSLGYSSVCEILEFELVGDTPLCEVPARMNAVLPEGIRVLDCYEAQVPVKQIAALRWVCRAQFDGGVPAGAGEQFLALFDTDALVIQKPSKKAKKGFTELDLIPLIHSLSLEERGSALELTAVLAAQNPGLNPELLFSTARERCPLFRPDFVEFHREEVLNANFEVFR
ncbi:MAG: TIGR03936 family radical SAM-associated protein [Oscillospiraceae bacterium]|nr:TIGR03936 family radical SAM-associated protein [Oscillospiraceae bacterium]